MVIKDATDPIEWPEFGATVRVTLYLDGSTLEGTAAAPHFARTGVVIATPRSGAPALIVACGPIPEGPADGDGWEITREHVKITSEGRSQWTVDPVPDGGRTLVVTAVVAPGFNDPDVLALALRQVLRSYGCDLLPHSWGPDLDEVASRLGAARERVEVLALQP
ncbi:hypothetical protein JOL79_06905 [Microbispora sp. RL4-1S]|uniref:Uncharacterized protein n=1 Tax=Microbispora oryzae TaxID=2806554 RepID=A0A941AI76_9ACTN|nr:hypothetical protein [Microbispora oryzae]MBP2703527.1 hypothetical protein [Microbispora oryzae]